MHSIQLTPAQFAKTKAQAISHAAKAWPTMSEEHSQILRDQFNRFRRLGQPAWKAMPNARAVSASLAGSI